MDADVPRVVEVGDQGVEMGFDAGEGEVLGDQHLKLIPVRKGDHIN